MAERRMFAKTIIDSDAFLDMPVTARLLYYDLAMRADDDGFVNAPKKIARMIGANADDIDELITKKFIIAFDTGIIVIKHWLIHNYIRKDTYHETKYKEEKRKLEKDENNSYRLGDYSVNEPYTFRRRDVDDSLTQVRLGKVSIGKDRLNTTTTTTAADDDGSTFRRFEEEFGRPLSSTECETFRSWMSEHPSELIDYALSKSVLSGKRNFSYIDGILTNWKSKGIRTVYEAEAEKEEFKASKSPPASKGIPRTFNHSNYRDDIYEI